MAGRPKAPAPALTSLSSCAGCAAKLDPANLATLLQGLPSPKAPRALVGYERFDDAAVWKLSATKAVVSTADFFPPVVDDPYAYGQIAAANALSDVWAMGGRPLFALNLVAFPTTLPLSVQRRILEGGAAKAAEAGVPILGGHSVQSPEPKYGLAVTGEVHPRRILTNGGGRPGDMLVLTKPLGTGVATTAIKRKLAPKPLVKQVTEQMATLNQAAGEVLATPALQVHALTDVTGFGLLGHLLEMAKGAGLRARLFLEQVPLLPGIAALAEAGVVPGGTQRNLAHVSRWVKFPRGLPAPIQHVLADAQTNGGLLAALPPAKVGRAVAALERRGVLGAVVGQLLPGRPGIDVL